MGKVCTAVVLYSDVEVCCAVGRGYVRWGGRVFEDFLVGGGVIGRAGGDAEEVLVCHLLAEKIVIDN